MYRFSLGSSKLVHPYTNRWNFCLAKKKNCRMEDCFEPLPPPTRFRKEMALKAAEEKNLKLILAYRQKYRKAAIEVELFCSPPCRLNPVDDDWRKIFEGMSCNKPKNIDNPLWNPGKKWNTQMRLSMYHVAASEHFDGTCEHFMCFCKLKNTTPASLITS